MGRGPPLRLACGAFRNQGEAWEILPNSFVSSSFMALLQGPPNCPLLNPKYLRATRPVNEGSLGGGVLLVRASEQVSPCNEESSFYDPAQSVTSDSCSCYGRCFESASIILLRLVAAMCLAPGIRVLDSCVISIVICCRQFLQEPTSASLRNWAGGLCPSSFEEMYKGDRSSDIDIMP